MSMAEAHGNLNSARHITQQKETVCRLKSMLRSLDLMQEFRRVYILQELMAILILLILRLASIEEVFWKMDCIAEPVIWVDSTMSDNRVSWLRQQRAIWKLRLMKTGLIL